MDITIRSMTHDDWLTVRAIYVEGIATGNATFETDTPEWEAWDKSHLSPCRLVAKHEGQVIGWAALTPVSGLCAQTGVAEVSIYVAESARGLGIGRALLRALVQESEHQGFWTLQAQILDGNEASIALHKSCNFRVVGCRERFGQLNGSWRDMLLLERRSQVVGV